MSYLIFVDTNIFLDFYEVDSGDATLPLLKYIDANHSKIISTSEVEMEFKKNRQRVILKCLNPLKINRSDLITTPAFLRNSTLNTSIRNTQEKLLKQSSTITERALEILRNPGEADPVYKTLQKFFQSRRDCHLSRDKKVRYKIRSLARKRFSLGYPPRKDSDISLIDAINWEWIIYCAQNCSHDITIVSRDTDYGVHQGKESILNDWLAQEFKERVSQKRSIYLTQSLSEAFKRASITVSKEEEKAEETLLEERDRVSRSFQSTNLNSYWHYDPAALQAAMERMQKSYNPAALQAAMERMQKSYDRAALQAASEKLPNDPPRKLTNPTKNTKKPKNKLP